MPLALFDLGFRPFFALASIFAALAMVLWVVAISGGSMPAGHFEGAAWHAHEMVFGYGAAVVAGFLLTAVANWTGLPTLRGGWLCALCALWLAGRLALGIATGPSMAAAAVDIAFLLILAPYLAAVIIRGGKFSNLPIVGIVALLAFANVATHAGVLRADGALVALATRLSVLLLVVLIVIVGGRVIPFFTRRRIEGSAPRGHVALDAAAVAVTVAYAIAFALSVETALPWIAGVAAVAHLARLSGWIVRGLAREPMLWILFAGYAWIALGFALSVSTSTRWFALHAWTAGAIGATTAGMMLRVGLGHTGRPIVASGVAVAAFALINAAAALRALAPLAVPQYYEPLTAAAGVAWIAGFAALAAILVPVVTGPRVDASAGP